MPGAVGVRGLGVPSLHSERGVSALNHKPMQRIAARPATNFASVLLLSCHCSLPLAWMAGGVPISLYTDVGLRRGIEMESFGVLLDRIALRLPPCQSAA